MKLRPISFTTMLCLFVLAACLYGIAEKAFARPLAVQACGRFEGLHRDVRIWQEGTTCHDAADIFISAIDRRYPLRRFNIGPFRCAPEPLNRRPVILCVAPRAYVQIELKRRA